MEDLYELMNAPKWVQLVMFFGFSLFLVVLLVVVSGLVQYIRQDRHLKKHYFDQWKLRKGSLEDRRRVIIPSDPFLNKLTSQSNKIHHYIMLIWLAVLLIVLVIAGVTELV